MSSLSKAQEAAVNWNGRGLLLSAAAVLAGLTIFMFFACRAVTKGAAVLTKKIALWIKSLFLRKEETK